MNNTKKQRTIYFVLLIATIAIVVTAITLSLVFGLSGGNELPDDSITTNAPQDDTDDNDDDNVNTDDESDDSTTTTPDDDTPTDDSTDVSGTATDYEMPLDNYTLGQECSLDTLVWSSTLEWYSTHNGVDFLADEGTPVKAVFTGDVTATGYTTLDGYYVIITQTDGIISTYKSLTADLAVESGDTVYAGSVIGYVGTSMTSEASEGAHLHLEMTEDGDYIDPMTKLVTDEK